MKSLLAAAAMLVIALGTGESTAQTSSVTPSGMGSTSPLGMGLGSLTTDPQSVTLLYSGNFNPGPCSTGNQGKAGPSTFDGGGITLSTSLAPSTQQPGDFGARPRSAPCSAVSSSGIRSSPNSLTTTSASGNASSTSSPLSGAGNTSTTPSSSPNAAAIGVAGLGSSGLGTTSLGSLSAGSASASQVTPPATGVGGSPTFCSRGSAGGSTTSSNISANASSGMNVATSMTSAVTTRGAGGDASGAVRDPARGVGTGPYDPAQSLAGAASVPATNAVGAPCLTGE
jgi:hypothetical protein